MNYGSAKWKNKRKRILKLDGYKDRVAAMYGKMLEGNMVHHIYPAEEYPEWAYEDWNLITVNKEQTHNQLENRKTGELTEKGLMLQKYIKPYENWRVKKNGTSGQSKENDKRT